MFYQLRTVEKVCKSTKHEVGTWTIGSGLGRLVFGKADIFSDLLFERRQRLLYELQNILTLVILILF